MKLLHIILGSLLVGAGLIYLIKYSPPSELGKTINKGISHQIIRNSCAKEIRKRIEKDQTRARKEVCRFIKHETNCLPSQDEILEWLKVEINQCAKSRIDS